MVSPPHMRHVHYILCFTSSCNRVADQYKQVQQYLGTKFVPYLTPINHLSQVAEIYLTLFVHLLSQELLKNSNIVSKAPQALINNYIDTYFIFQFPLLAKTRLALHVRHKCDEYIALQMFSTSFRYTISAVFGSG